LNVPLESNPDVLQVENEFETVEVKWEQNCNDLAESLRKAQEMNAALESALTRELDVIVASLINEMLDKIVLEVDHSEQRNMESIHEPKIKRPNLN